jgi:PPOX class probable FMN-dependent enzyme
MNRTADTTGSLPAWHESLRSSLKVHQEESGAFYVQLATMVNNASNRTVVFRGFFRNTSSLMIATDCRSNKVKELKAHPNGTLCWYFSKTREQYRISGTVRIIDAVCRDRRDAEARIDLWAQLSEGIREQFHWPEPCGVPPESLSIPRSLENPPSPFCLLVLNPEHVDYLNLGFRPHRRIIHKLQPDGSWFEREVNP